MKQRIFNKKINGLMGLVNKDKKISFIKSYMEFVIDINFFQLNCDILFTIPIPY